MNRVAASAVLVTMFGCRGSADSDGDRAKPGAAPTSPGEPTGDVDVCGLIPVATIAQITGKQFTSAEGKDNEHTKSFGVYSCNYTGANQLGLSIVGKNGKRGYDGRIRALNTAGQKAEDVPGIGDAAFSTTSPLVRLEVLYGDVTITVSGWTDLPIDQAKQIISQLHDKLGLK